MLTLCTILNKVILQWCYEGRCIEIGERPGAIDGGWSNWTVWSDCSRTCGSGVAFQERYCNNPAPSHGGRYCVGDHRRHKICSTEVTALQYRLEHCKSMHLCVAMRFWNAFVQGCPMCGV